MLLVSHTQYTISTIALNVRVACIINYESTASTTMTTNDNDEELRILRISSTGRCQRRKPDLAENAFWGTGTGTGTGTSLSERIGRDQ